jgi:molybdate transport system ATP-binding protein
MAEAAVDVELQQSAPIPLAARFTCARGELLALVGPSGAGKTTILRAIAGLVNPAAGQVRIEAETWFDARARIAVPTHRRAVGFVFQSYALFPHLTASGNVAAALTHLPRAARATEARRLLDLVHLAGLEERRPAALSGGQQQRVAVARALARRPRVLLLDEPFAAVDKVTRRKLYAELAELRRSLDIPMLLVTHDLDEAATLADQLAIVSRGRTLQLGAPAEIMRRPASVAVARLIDLRNVFDATVAGHDVARGITWLDWRGQRLETALRPELRPGSPVAWCVPASDIVLHRRERPSRGERENPIAGTIRALLPLGESASVALTPTAMPAAEIHFSLPMHVARRNALAPGAAATVSLLADAIHLMPPADAEPWREDP